MQEQIRQSAAATDDDPRDQVGDATPTLKSPRPAWQLPGGVTRGTWDYAHDRRIAEDYDAYFAFNRLFQFDEQVVREELTMPGLVADLGCGTGRVLLHLAERGFRGLAVDLSRKMLAMVVEKASAAGVDITPIHGSIVDMDFLADDAVDHAVCLFSTLGMIHGRQNRLRMLTHTRRILRPGGRFVLHVHNFWFNLLDPGGPWWVLKNLCQATFRRDIEAGDKYFHYRGIPNMFLHVFRRREIRRLLLQAGFRIRRMIPLATDRQGPLKYAWMLGGVRASGWIVVCE